MTARGGASLGPGLSSYLHPFQRLFEWKKWAVVYTFEMRPRPLLFPERFLENLGGAW